ncbi:MAG: hypothetical protein R2795_19125 [Saprospiraceae bacterium]
MLTAQQIQFFADEGYLMVANLITPEEVEYFRQVYEDFLSGKIETGSHRSDLSGTTDTKGRKK